jgi:hypothetical protein
MRHFTIACIVLMLAPLSPAKAQDDKISRQINEQVWLPFINTFNNMYTEGFMALHSKKLIRIPEDSKRIFTYDEYYENTKRSNDAFKKANYKQTIELRFINRFADKVDAFETGFYKTVIAQSDGIKKTAYGKFHVMLHMEKEVWKITFDTDAAEAVDETLFQTGTAIQH